MSSIELINPEIDRVDAVNGPATGLPFLMFKSADGAPVAKSGEDAEELAEEAAEAADPNIDGTPVDEATAAAAEPGDPAWEAVDAAKARVAVAGLAVLQKLVAELAQRESAEGDDYENAFDLEDAGDALDFALGVLARFSVTEQLEADAEAEEAEAQARALGLIKALHLEVHDGEKAPAAPAAGEPASSPAEAPVEDSLTPEAPAATAPAAPAVKADEEPLPAGLSDILDSFVESYAQWKAAQDGPEADLASPAEFEQQAGYHTGGAEPVADAQAPEAPAAPAAPAEAPKAEAPAAPAAAPAPKPEAPKAEAPKAEAPADAEDPEKLTKSMQEAIAKAIADATAPLLKKIDVLERTPVDSGPMFAGQTPGGLAGLPLVRGQEEGRVAKGLTSATGQAAPGTNTLAERLKAIHTGN